MATETVPGDPTSRQNAALMTGASVSQSFAPIKQIGAHLNAFHAYADDPASFVETNHYCAHLNDDVRQCLLYDSAEPGARLIGIEYMISPTLFEGLSSEERKLWHSHVYEVKSGMLVMPNSSVPTAVWEVAENKEMEQVVKLYGKVYHLWQTDKGDKLPLGEPKLMTSFTADGQFDFEQHVGARDKRFNVDWRKKKEARDGIPSPNIHLDADQAWKSESENTKASSQNNKAD